MIYVFAFVTPIVAIIFFVNGVALAKKIVKGGVSTAHHTAWGAIMFGYLILSILWSIFLTP
ncbi:hypothetical protein [Paenibacillus ginsengarvi]|uniref:Uncharacterized protein n=1 Tax=Paenibacillus ginsengarvi TaxID=400777 RepID=A0A3B0BWK7_9BACL|nr:hypothetical protein [Paenibacillus ginsengarvi]RKN75856.1 hypothetical protein D7M11_25465 [Paenibacillus ginsengarvi]